jgi:hypothetical protein
MSAARHQREVQQLFFGRFGRTARRRRWPWERGSASAPPEDTGPDHSAERCFLTPSGVHAICSLISLAAASFLATRSSLKPIAVPLSPGPSATD